MFFNQDTYAQKYESVKSVEELIETIGKLKDQLEDLKKQLEETPSNNGTNIECNCKELNEKIEDLKSKLEELQEAVNNATKTDCDCVGSLTKIPVQTGPGGATVGATTTGFDIKMILIPIIVGIGIAITSWFGLKPKNV